MAQGLTDRSNHQGMNTFRDKLLVAAACGIVFCFVAAVCSTPYLDSIYAARVAKGGEQSPMDLGFQWYFFSIGAGLLGFAVALSVTFVLTRRK